MATMPATNRMLIVEDDPGVRRLMTSHFRQNGFQVEYAVAAEEVADDERYDVVLTDVHLPGESGVDLARRMHVLRPNQQVVFVTGDSDASLAREALDAGAAGYLLKPFEMFELDAVVNAAIRKNVTPPVFRPHMHVTAEPLVVLAPHQHHTKRTLRERLRVAAAVLAMLAIAWVAGALISPKPVTNPGPNGAATPNDNRPVVVPVVMEKSVYLR